MPSVDSRPRSLSPYSRRARQSRRDPRSRSRSPYPRYSRTPSPPSRKARSPSPRTRREDRPRKSTNKGGIRWKEKSREDDYDDRQDKRRLERGYRDLDKPRARSPVRDSGGRDDDIESKFGPQKPASKHSQNTNEDKGVKVDEEKPKKEKKSKPKIAPTSQEMIIVNVNDRLGTKAAIPCLASDPISTLHPQQFPSQSIAC